MNNPRGVRPHCSNFVLNLRPLISRFATLPFNTPPHSVAVRLPPSRPVGLNTRRGRAAVSWFVLTMIRCGPPSAPLCSTLLSDLWIYGAAALVAILVAEGHSNKQIAKVLSVSIKTVETHRAATMRKLELTSTAGLVRYAVRNKLIEP